ncbi:MAG: PPC domain-containing protein [Planctomycetota bacterium]
MSSLQPWNSGHSPVGVGALSCFVFLAMVLGTTCVRAAEPELRQIFPRGGQRGTAVDVRMFGERLFDAAEIIFHHPGITASTPTVIDGTKIDVRLSIASDCRLGEHAVRVRTRSGISSFFTFWVGPYPTVEEVEPNSEFLAPQPISLGVTVAGVITNEDVDYYRVEAKAGERLAAEVEGMRLGSVIFDPYLAILDVNRFELIACDDSALLLQDPTVSVVVPKDGEYIVAVRSASFRGSKRHFYRLHVGSYPRTLVVFPAGGPAGSETTVRALGDAAGETEVTVTGPTARHRADRVAEVFPEIDGATPPSGVAFRISDLNNVLEVEPNGNRRKPNAVEAAIPFALNGVVQEDGDRDWYRFVAKKNVTYEFQVLARRLRSPLDPVLTVHEAGGKYLAGNDDTAGPDSFLRWKAPKDGPFLIQLRDHLRRGGSEYVYRIEVTLAKPRLSVTIPQIRRYQQFRQAIAVPRGNRVAVRMRADRRNFGGPLVLDLEGLPGGLVAHYEGVPNGEQFVPVVFEAPADAELGGWVHPFEARHEDPKREISGPFYQQADFVRADPNNTVYYKGHVDALALAVTEEAPFKLTLQEPKVPLVRGGGMSLVIDVERAEGFDAPIRLEVPFRPAGVGAARNVKIEKGKTRAHLWINANDEAWLTPRGIAVNGTASVRGPLTVSSALVTLRVEDRYVLVSPQLTAVTRGAEGEVVCPIEVKRPFEGTARAELVGLPAHCSAEPEEFTAKDTEIVFTVKTSAKSPIGRHKTLFVRSRIPEAGTTILHHSKGRAILRVDPPPKAIAKAPPPKAEKAKPKKGEAKKRLSRLEKLRREHQERRRLEREAAEKASGAEGPAKAESPPKGEASASSSAKKEAQS